MLRKCSFPFLVLALCMAGTAGAQTTIQVDDDAFRETLTDYIQRSKKLLGQTGVCCLPNLGDGVCIEGLPDSGGEGFLAAAACTLFGGTFTTGGSCATDCSLDLRACCLVNGNCIVVVPDDCATAGGTTQPADLTCATAVCISQLRACCLPNGNCVAVRPVVCTNLLGGVPNLGLFTCAAANCPPPDFGACCFDAGICVDTTSVDCAAAGGAFQAGMPCDVNPCPPVAMAACCMGTTCMMRTACDCAIEGGEFLGDGVTCAGNPCLTGACCDECDQTCTVLREEQCTSVAGFYLGDGSTCDESTCLLKGACCLPGSTCVDTTIEACEALNGMWSGLGTTCSTTDCAGACCFIGTGVCNHLLMSRCVSAGGLWQGPGTVCSDGCDQVLTPVPGDGEPTVLEVLRNWGDCSKPCPADRDGNGRVDLNDLVGVLSEG